MDFEFKAEADPPKASCEALAKAAPTNPFCTFEYLESRRALGYQPWIYWWRQAGQLASGCSAYARKNPLGGTLVIPSLPVLTEETGSFFWQKLVCFSGQKRLPFLTIDSAASERSDIPHIRGEVFRRSRCEYILDLEGEDLWERLSSNHARNIKRARQSGLQLSQRQDESACLEHAQMIRASMERRKSRGEDVSPEDVKVKASWTYVKQGAGKLFQATLDGRILSSLLILQAEKGAYYKSAGTSPEGMSLGASQFLVHEISNWLAHRSMIRFNLGGADSLNPGLQRFKAGFGSKVVELEAADFFLGSAAQRQLIAVMRGLKSAARRCLQFRQK